MDANHTLKMLLSHVPDVNVSITPSNATLAGRGSVSFTSMLSGGRSPYFYQWFINGTPVWDATSPQWTFTPQKSGIYNVNLSVAWPFSGRYTMTFVTSNISRVTVSILCDVSSATLGMPDGKVDMRDISYFAQKFGTTQSSPNWDPRCDITGPIPDVPDGVVNMRDISVTCSNFGKES